MAEADILTALTTLTNGEKLEPWVRAPKAWVSQAPGRGGYDTKALSLWRLMGSSRGSAPKFLSATGWGEEKPAYKDLLRKEREGKGPKPDARLDRGTALLRR